MSYEISQASFKIHIKLHFFASIREFFRSLTTAGYSRSHSRK